MKATLLNDEEMVNPLYLSAVDKKGIQPILPIPAGTVMDNPDAWMLVALNKAVPADDECKERIDRWLGNPKRLALIEQIKRLRAANGVKALDAKTKRWLEYMEKTYAKELGLEPASSDGETDHD